MLAILVVFLLLFMSVLHFLLHLLVHHHSWSYHARSQYQGQVVGMEAGRDLRVGILDTLVVAQDDRAHQGEKLDSPGVLLGEWERDLGERSGWQVVDEQHCNLQGTRR